MKQKEEKALKETLLSYLPKGDQSNDHPHHPFSDLFLKVADTIALRLFVSIVPLVEEKGDSIFWLNHLMSDAQHDPHVGKRISMTRDDNCEPIKMMFNEVLRRGFGSDYFFKRDSTDVPMIESYKNANGRGFYYQNKHQLPWIIEWLHKNKNGFTEIMPFAPDGINVDHIQLTIYLRDAKSIINDLMSYYSIDSSKIVLSALKRANPSLFSMNDHIADNDLKVNNDVSTARVYFRSNESDIKILHQVEKDSFLELYKEVSKWLMKILSHNITGMLIDIPVKFIESDKKEAFPSKEFFNAEIDVDAIRWLVSNNVSVSDISEIVSNKIFDSLMNEDAQKHYDTREEKSMKIEELYRYNFQRMKRGIEKHDDLFSSTFNFEGGNKGITGIKKILRGILVLLESYNVDKKMSNKELMATKNLSITAASSICEISIKEMSGANESHYFQKKTGLNIGSSRAEGLKKDAGELKKMIDKFKTNDDFKNDVVGLIKRRSTLSELSLITHY